MCICVFSRCHHRTGLNCCCYVQYTCKNLWKLVAACFVVVVLNFLFCFIFSVINSENIKFVRYAVNSAIICVSYILCNARGIHFVLAFILIFIHLILHKQVNYFCPSNITPTCLCRWKVHDDWVSQVNALGILIFLSKYSGFHVLTKILHYNFGLQKSNRLLPSFEIDIKNLEAIQTKTATL